MSPLSLRCAPICKPTQNWLDRISLNRKVTQFENSKGKIARRIISECLGAFLDFCWDPNCKYYGKAWDVVFRNDLWAPGPNDLFLPYRTALCRPKPTPFWQNHQHLWREWILTHSDLISRVIIRVLKVVSAAWSCYMPGRHFLLTETVFSLGSQRLPCPSRLSCSSELRVCQRAQSVTTAKWKP